MPKLQEEFKINTTVGKLSAIVDCPEKATHVLILAHGAGADYKHAHMQSLATAFNSVGIATLRFNFPFTENGKRRVDSKDVSIACIADAATAARKRLNLPLLVGGHSFGGRMATHAVTLKLVDCEALILCSFPLHPAGKPGTERAQHLCDITVPMLFLSGTRDTLADRDLFEQEIAKLNSAQRIHWLDTADHSYKVLKRTRAAEVDVYTEAAEAARDFLHG